MEAMWACKPVLGAWLVMCAWASVSQFLPRNSATLQFQVLMSMQMDAEFKKEQNSTRLCLVGALEGWFGGSLGVQYIMYKCRAPPPPKPS
jgi:hypothetical protein